MATVAPSIRTYECARCGKKRRPDRMVFSRFTRLHYCADLDACSRRAARRQPEDSDG